MTARGAHSSEDEIEEASLRAHATPAPALSKENIGKVLTHEPKNLSTITNFASTPTTKISSTQQRSSRSEELGEGTSKLGKLLDSIGSLQLRLDTQERTTLQRYDAVDKDLDSLARTILSLGSLHHGAGGGGDTRGVPCSRARERAGFSATGGVGFAGVGASLLESQNR